MLKAILTELHSDEALLISVLVGTGHLDANASPERLEAVLAEMRADLEAAGIEVLAAPAAAPAAVDGMKPADPAAA